VSRASPVDEASYDVAAVFKPAQAGATILVVEDEVLVRLMITDELRAQGYLVVEAANADEALAVLRSTVAVDLLLTDVRMPGTHDGLDLARLVRAAHPSVKVIIASGQMPDSVASVATDGFFAKPYDVERLVARINGLLVSGKANCARSS